MPYLEVFDLFWKEVVDSAASRDFVKLTMAKTIGKPNLRNIFVRPIDSEGDYKVSLQLRYRSRETEDQEDELTLDEAYEVVKLHLVKSFSSILLFTTSKDVTFKVNKKRAGSITAYAPTMNRE